MEKVRLYHALLILHESNLRVLHWKLCGSDFDDAHKRFQGYYETVGEFVDQTAERIVVMGLNPMNIQDALNMVQDSETKAFIMPANLNYGSDTANVAAKRMFDDLCTLAVELADDTSIPSDTRDTFLKQSTYFENEGCYKLERFICKPSAADES